MKAYKFRTTANFDFIADILIHRRLYCSEARSLNDVREADIRVGNDAGREMASIEFGDRVRGALARHRVCCLCDTFDNQLLWAYYAGGFTGLAIEVELPDADVTRVTYSKDFIFASDFLDANNFDGAARAALSKKHSAWGHEREVRIVTTERFYQLTSPICRVITGCRMTSATATALYLICSHFGIPVDRAVVADFGIYTVGLQPMGLHSPALNGTVA